MAQRELVNFFNFHKPPRGSWRPWLRRWRHLGGNFLNFSGGL
jgi:hypothetical protein